MMHACHLQPPGPPHSAKGALAFSCPGALVSSVTALGAAKGQFMICAERAKTSAGSKSGSLQSFAFNTVTGKPNYQLGGSLKIILVIDHYVVFDI